MLEAIRERAQGWIAKVILALIIVPFAIWGIESYFTGGGGGKPVASVGDDQVSQQEFFRALQNQRDAQQEQTRAKVDIENKDFRRKVLDELVQVRLIADAARRNGLSVSGNQADAVIKSAPIFQVNGSFSEERFQTWLREQGLSQKGLAAMIEREALVQQFQMGYGQGAVAASASAERLSALMAQQREVTEAVFAAETYQKSVVVDDKAVEADYNANKNAYATPAQVRIQYLVLSADSILAGIKISDEAAKQYYEANKSHYQAAEQRSASHILVKADNAAARPAAKAKAEKLLAQVKANPGKFAELAKQNSDDPGSAAQGGELGSFTRDTMVKPFADAVFGMKVGDISGLVETEFGYHIIRLTGVTPGKLAAFDAVKGEIVAELGRQQAERKFAEVAERFSNLVYEKPDSLDPAAAEFGLTVKESGWISRDQAEPAFLAKPALMDALFSPEALEKKQNTEAVEVAGGTLVAARVLEHKPAGVRPLAEVAPLIRAKLSLRAAQVKAVELGQAALKAAEAGQAVPGMSAPMLVSRMQPLNLPVEGLKAIFKANVGKLPATVGVETPGGYRLYRITRVIEGAVDANRTKMVQRDLSRVAAQEELKAYLAYVKDSTKVQINETILEKKAE
ncbi:MAG: peptidylprolyl isomerase [Thiobacillus sp.]|nr:peptidylprolyl isomerase [Thiobacillus sp.]